MFSQTENYAICSRRRSRGAQGSRFQTSESRSTLEDLTGTRTFTSPTDVQVGSIRNLWRHHMHVSRLVVTRQPSRRLLVSIASTALLASGCSNLVSTAPESGAASSAATVSGRVHGGNQPVAGATVNLYFAGQSGIASKPILAATTSTADDGAGSFSFISRRPTARRTRETRIPSPVPPPAASLTFTSSPAVETRSIHMLRL